MFFSKMFCNIATKCITTLTHVSHIYYDIFPYRYPAYNSKVLRSGTS